MEQTLTPKYLALDQTVIKLMLGSTVENYYFLSSIHFQSVDGGLHNVIFS